MIELRKVDFIQLKPLLEEAEKDESLAGYVYPEDSERKRIAIFYASQLVGFFTPRQEENGIWRMGAIFVRPEFRAKSIASQAIREFLQGKKALAFIEDDNVASQKAYLKAGFHVSSKDEELNGSWYSNFES